MAEEVVWPPAQGLAESSQNLNWIPPVRHIKPMDNLAAEFKHSATMGKMVEALKKVYKAFRRVRGDGDCYYRSVMYSYVEFLILQGEEAVRSFIAL